LGENERQSVFFGNTLQTLIRKGEGTEVKWDTLIETERGEKTLGERTYKKTKHLHGALS